MDSSDEVAPLRASWQFPAVQKLLSLLSTSLNFPPPSSSTLEYALLHPRNHFQLLADLHGRMHGFTMGASAAKRWLAATAKLLHDFPTDEENYCQLTAVQRLIFMYELVDIATSERDLLSRIDYQPQELRVFPFGTDAVGNQYFYFGDCQRVYRSPSAKVSAKGKQERERAEKRRLKAEKEAAVARRRSARQERDKVKWAHRVSSGRVTRAARRVETQSASKRSSSGRKAANSPQRSFDNSSPTPVKRPRCQFEDNNLRACTHWETLSTDTASLEAFVELFGMREQLLGVERVLIRRIVEEILPGIREMETRAKREAERKARTELLMTNQKRSTRVRAITAKREEEARREAQQEEAERLEEQRIVEHQREVARLVKEALVLQSQDIREQRQLHGNSEAILRDETSLRKAEKQRVAANALPTRRSRRQRGMHVEKEEGTVQNGDVREGSDANDTDNTNGDISELDRIEVPGEDEVDEDEKPGKVNGKVEDVREENGNVKGNNAISTNGATEKVKKEDHERFVGARVETAIDRKFSWNVNADDGLPSRVLDKFFFANRADFSDAPLERCDEKDHDVMGVGILLPPLNSNAEVCRVVIDEVCEWMFEYGRDAKLWIKSRHSWYELRDAAVEYRNAFTSGRRKFEVCARISILGEVMRGAQLGYDSMIGYLAQSYGKMKGYKEEDVLLEKRYIVNQMEELNKKAIQQSGFLRALQKKIRTEERRKKDRERAAARRKEEAAVAVVKEEAEKVSTAAETTGGRDVKEDVAESKKAVVKKEGSAKRRRKDGVPRVVSMLVNELLKSAVKSYKAPRKRKLKGDEGVGSADIGGSTGDKKRKVEGLSEKQALVHAQPKAKVEK